MDKYTMKNKNKMGEHAKPKPIVLRKCCRQYDKLIKNMQEL